MTRTGRSDDVVGAGEADVSGFVSKIVLPYARGTTRVQAGEYIIESQPVRGERTRRGGRDARSVPPWIQRAPQGGRFAVFSAPRSSAAPGTSAGLPSPWLDLATPSCPPGPPSFGLISR